MRLLPLTLAVLTPTLSVAAEVTDLPPNLRGDIAVTYGGQFQQVGIAEDDLTLGIREWTQHDVTLGLTFTVYTGLAVTLSLPITASSDITYPSAREMLYEPVTGQGSYVNGLGLDTMPVSPSSGLQGAWIGLAGAPFRYDYAMSYPIDTRFDVSVRTPAPEQTRYGANRGASPGGAAVRLAGAFSVRRGPAEPYLKLAYTAELPADVAVTNLDGSDGGTVTVQAASALDATVGAELIALHDADMHHRVAIDLHMGFGYRSPEEVATGFWLPSVLPASQGLSITRGEYLLIRGGAALDVSITKFVGLRLGAEGQWLSPHTIEHPYPASTDPQSWGITWTAGLVGRIRLKDDRP